MALLEHLQGSGLVKSDNGEEVRAEYDIQITQDEVGDRTVPTPMPLFKHLAGRVWSEHDPYFVLAHARKILVLQMEDGRRFKFFHRGIDGKIGFAGWIG